MINKITRFQWVTRDARKVENNLSRRDRDGKPKRKSKLLISQSLHYSVPILGGSLLPSPRLSRRRCLPVVNGGTVHPRQITSPLIPSAGR